MTPVSLSGVSPSSIVHHRHMPDGYMYELRRVRTGGDEEWEARRQEGDKWERAKSVAFALIFASGGDLPDPEEFAQACRRWEKELRR